jgi:hypothetical protein
MADQRLSSSELKKLAERRAFDLARPFIPDWHIGDIDDQGEEPDIVVNAPGGAVGIEVRSIIDGDLRALLAAKRNSIGMAHTRYVERTGVVGLKVDVLFEPGLRLEKADQESTADELMEIVSVHFPCPTQDIVVKELRVVDDFRSRRLAMVRLHFHPEIPRSHWQEAAAHWTPILSRDEIQAAITAKEGNVSRYRGRAPTCWLLVTANGFGADAAHSIDDSAKVGIYESSFDGVVLLDDMARKAYRLAITPPARSR